MSTLIDQKSSHRLFTLGCVLLLELMFLPVESVGHFYDNKDG